jgi:uncharacterized protein YukE
MTYDGASGVRLQPGGAQQAAAQIRTRGKNIEQAILQLKSDLTHNISWQGEAAAQHVVVQRKLDEALTHIRTVVEMAAQTLESATNRLVTTDRKPYFNVG